MKRSYLFSVALLSLSACSGSQQPAPTAFDDAVYAQAMETGESSFALKRYKLAVSQYRIAAQQALRRDDGQAMAEAGYDLAVSQLASGQPQDALQTTQEVAQALQQRHDAHVVSLGLVQAAAYYQLKNYAQAIEQAKAPMGVSDKELAGRAALIMGLAGNAGGNEAALMRANERLQSLKAPLTSSLQADKMEVQALVLLKTNPARSMELAEQTADLRRDESSYREMSRALALAAQAASAAGDKNKATVLWTKAAQSAAAQSDGQMLKEANQWSLLAGGVALHPLGQSTPQN